MDCLKHALFRASVARTSNVVPANNFPGFYQMFLESRRGWERLLPSKASRWYWSFDELCTNVVSAAAATTTRISSVWLKASSGSSSVAGSASEGQQPGCTHHAVIEMQRYLQIQRGWAMEQGIIRTGVAHHWMYPVPLSLTYHWMCPPSLTSICIHLFLHCTAQGQDCMRHNFTSSFHYSLMNK